MHKFVFGVAFAAAVWSVPAWAIIGSTTIKVTDGGQPVPTATVTLTFKDKAGKPVGKPVRRPATRVGTPKIEIPDNTATVDISVSTPRRTARRNSVDIGLLTNKDFTIDVPGGSRPPGPPPGQPPSAAIPVSPPPIDQVTGPVVGLGAGSQTAVCDDWKTTGVETLAIVDPLGESPNACASSAFRGSIYLGYSRRIGTNYLAGIEADFGLTNKTGTITGIPGTVGGVPGLTAAASASDSVTLKRTWDASLRGRFGYFLNPRAVIYATGGLALQRVEATVNCSAAGVCGLGPTPFTASNSKTMSGWTLGGGVEYAVTERILVRGEYRYADHGTFTASYGTGTNAAFTADVRMRTHTVMVGIGLRFGDMR